MPADFVHLHLHSQYSLLDGANRLDDLIETVSREGMNAVAVTDHGNLFGSREFYKKAMKKGIRPIIGVEAYLARGSRLDRKDPQAERAEDSYGDGNFHLTLLAATDEGWRNLMSLVSEAYTTGFYYKPRMDKELLRAHSGGLICLTGCLKGEVCQALSRGDFAAAERAARELVDIFGKENVFVEVMDHGMPEQQKIVPDLMRLADLLGVPAVATNDCHYLRRDDAESHEILLAIGTGRTLDDEKRMRFPSNEFFVKSPEEMMATFGKTSAELVTNTAAVAAKAMFEFEKEEFHLPRYETPDGSTAEVFFRRLAEEGLDERLRKMKPLFDAGRKKHTTEEYRRRLALELDVIAKMGFPGYFLVVWDFIAYAKRKGIPVGPGRGSAAGSLVAYALKITDVDPLDHDLLFERFLNPDRITMPDIDVDFCQARRHEVITYVTEKYGRENVAQIVTFNRLKPKAAIRDVGRVLGLPYAEVDRISKLVPDGSESCAKAIKDQPLLAEMVRSDERVRKLFDLAGRLEGLARHAGMHAAGVVIAPRPITEFVPLYKTNNDEITTQYEMKGLEEMGLLKMDFLGLITLDVIDGAIKTLAASGTTVDLDEIPIDDPETFRLFQEGRTNGVFQFESSGMKDLLRRSKPTAFSDLVALNALYRPGALDAGMVDTFIERKKGKQAVRYLHPAMEEVLRETYGVICYQEQVMQITQRMGGFSLGQADLLRRAMGKKDKDLLGQQRQKFVDGCKGNGIAQKLAGEVFDQIEPFARYGFNKSHSVAYALVAYQTAWLKAHHPVHFMASMLTACMSSTDDMVKYVNECAEMGIQVLPPDINISDLAFTVVGDRIRFGLAAVKGVGEGVVEKILEARRRIGTFTTFPQFCSEVDRKGINRKVLECLIKSGSFDSLAPNRRSLFDSIDRVTSAVAKEKEAEERGQIGLFGGFGVESVAEMEIPTLPEWSADPKLRFEKETLGFYVTGHPLAKFAEDLDRFGNAKCENLAEKRDTQVKIGGVVVGLKRTKIKKGKNEGKLLTRFTLEDLTGTVPATIFADLTEKTTSWLLEETAVFATATVRAEEGSSAEITIQEIQPLEGLREKLAREVHIRVDLAGLDADALAMLREKLAEHPGNIPVVFELRRPGAFRARLRPHRALAVAPSAALARDIERLVGQGGVRYRFER
jgi:DNA polymerase-3 subunit alpha